MPIRPTLVRTLAAAWLAASTLLAAGAGPAAALDPPQPLPGYHPAFVTETDTRPWQDCLWASGAMLLDKWTNGRDVVSRQALRRLSGDTHGGSTLADLRTAYAKLGIALAYSPDGGATITWRTLLSRLEHGAGAVLLGDDSKLPRWYGRWDPPFWRATDEGDNHAVYIERYDRKRGRVWLMDPLGRGDWAGEWISVKALKAYAWTTRAGVLSVAVTPIAKPAPFTGVVVGTAIATQTPRTLEVSWGIRTPDGWRFPGADVTTRFSVDPDPLVLAATSAAPVAQLGSSDLPARPVASVSERTLRAVTPLPLDAGAYAATTTLKDRRFGHVVARSGPFAVFVPGDRHAALDLQAADTTVIAGSAVNVALTVANIGSATWAEGPLTIAASTQLPVRRNTHVVARWIPISVRADALPGGTAVDDPVAADPTPPPDVTLGVVPLAPGGRSELDGQVTVPETPGVWAMVLDVRDDVDGSFAALGSAPAVRVFVVVGPGVIPTQVGPIADG